MQIPRVLPSAIAFAIVETCVALSSAAFAFGLVGIAMPLFGWWGGGGYYYSVPFFVLALLALILGLILWRVFSVAVLRSVARAATMASVALLVSCGLYAGYIDTRSAMHLAIVKINLRDLVQAQEELRRDSGRFSPTLPPGYTPSQPYAEPMVTLTPDGFTASMRDTVYSRTCAIFVGRTPLAPATKEGVSACTRPPFDWRDYIFGIALLGVGVALAGLALAVEKR